MMKNTFAFEKLIVWNETKELIKSLYNVLSNTNFPEQEKYNLVSQMKRCSVSIASNIAEGTVRQTQKEKQRFIHIAYGSAIELINQLIISEELGYIDSSVLEEMRGRINDICAMLSGLKRNIR